MRKTEFAIGEFYHIFNRGVDKRKIFQDESDFRRFWQSLILLNDERSGLMLSWRNCKRDRPSIDFKTFAQQESGSDRKPLVDIISYCLNSNHFHFILKQSADDGIRKFMHKVGTSYANYFNERYDRTGALFEGRFKSIHVKNDSRLLYLSAYVNCNSEVHGIAKAIDYKWCSFSEYVGKKGETICSKKIILEQFHSRKDYREYAREVVKEARRKKEDEKDIIE
jgi:putative transposase